MLRPNNYVICTVQRIELNYWTEQRIKNIKTFFIHPVSVNKIEINEYNDENNFKCGDGFYNDYCKCTK